MISSGEIHPDLQEMSVRDDFQRRKSSWFARNVCGGWFPAGKCILISRKCLWGMISNGEIDPDLQEMPVRDDFQRGNASWFARNACEGWFPAEKLILICKKCLWGMISNGEIHPDLQEMSERDDFQRENASWFAKNVLEGWFSTGKCILICKKCLRGMISSEEMHPDLQKMSWRDDSRRGKASWLAGNVWEGWFPTGKCILISRKCLWGMISNEEMHPDSIKISGRDALKRKGIFKPALPARTKKRAQLSFLFACFQFLLRT